MFDVICTRRDTCSVTFSAQLIAPYRAHKTNKRHSKQMKNFASSSPFIVKWPKTRENLSPTINQLESSRRSSSRSCNFHFTRAITAWMRISVFSYTPAFLSLTSTFRIHSYILARELNDYTTFVDGASDIFTLAFHLSKEPWIMCYAPVSRSNGVHFLTIVLYFCIVVDSIVCVFRDQLPLRRIHIRELSCQQREREKYENGETCRVKWLVNFLPFYRSTHPSTYSTSKPSSENVAQVCKCRLPTYVIIQRGVRH